MVWAIRGPQRFVGVSFRELPWRSSYPEKLGRFKLLSLDFRLSDFRNEKGPHFVDAALSTPSEDVGALLPSPSSTRSKHPRNDRAASFRLEEQNDWLMRTIAEPPAFVEQSESIGRQFGKGEC